MIITHYDIRLFYRCSMLLYLNHHGPEEERKIHPIIQQRRKSTKKYVFDENKINEQLDKTFIQMNKGKEIINQGWVGFENYVAKVSRFSKKDGSQHSPSLSSSRFSFSFFFGLFILERQRPMNTMERALAKREDKRNFSKNAIQSMRKASLSMKIEGISS